MAKKDFNNNLCKLLCVVCALLVFGLLAEEGKCGDNITYRFDEATGTLSISGQGKMWDFEDKVGQELKRLRLQGCH